jgi:phosphoribosyl-ATP pyrophosphohydrolase
MFNQLFDIIEDRKKNPQPGSYTNFLLNAGEDEILKKVGEEAVEIILAAKNQGDERLVEEVSDLLYHVFVLLSFRGLQPAQIAAELERRHQPKALKPES